MQFIAEVGKPVDVTYRAKKLTTGLTDVVAKIYDETRAQDLVNFPNITLTEIGTTGIYYGSFIPDAAGIWMVPVDSASNSNPAEFTIVVGNYDLDSLGIILDTVETKVDAVQAAVDDLADPSQII